MERVTKLWLSFLSAPLTRYAISIRRRSRRDHEPVTPYLTKNGQTDDIKEKNGIGNGRRETKSGSSSWLEWRTCSVSRTYTPMSMKGSPLQGGVPWKPISPRATKRGRSSRAIAPRIRRCAFSQGRLTRFPKRYGIYVSRSLCGSHNYRPTNGTNHRPKRSLYHRGGETAHCRPLRCV